MFGELLALALEVSKTIELAARAGAAGAPAAEAAIDAVAAGEAVAWNESKTAVAVVDAVAAVALHDMCTIATHKQNDRNTQANMN